MFDFDVPRYEKVVGDALAMRPAIESAVDQICSEGYSNLFFIGCGLAAGGTTAWILRRRYFGGRAAGSIPDKGRGGAATAAGNR